MRSLYESWGRKIRQRRVALGFTQVQLADKAGIGQSMLSKIESGDTCPSDDVKFRIAGALLSTPDLLFPYPPVVPTLPQAANQ